MNLCQYCKEQLEGRSDKKFCSLKCKNSFHAHQRDNQPSSVQKVDQILHRNRAILIELLKQNQISRTINRDRLDALNFNFAYVTAYHKNSRNKIVNYVYEFSWIIFSDRKILIKKLS